MRPNTILVIGYGNDLKGDDAAGHRAAHAVAAWELPQVRVCAVHQLTPELADPLAAAGRAIFLDAHVAPGAPALAVRRIFPTTPLSRVGHAFDPHALLALAARAFGRAPEAWWVTIPATDFSFGAPLSPPTERGVADALEAIRPLLHLPTTIDEATVTDGTETHRRDTGCPTR